MAFVRGLFCVATLAAIVPIAMLPAVAEPRSAADLAGVTLPQAKVVEPPAPVPSAAQAKSAVVARPAVTLAARVDLTHQTVTVVEYGKPLATWKISSGVQDHPTPVGNFQPEWTAKMWFSRKYDDAPMPNSVFFKNGAAIHATQSVGALGHAASHGCVRLAPANAETFYRLVQRHGLAHTRINVFGVPTFQRPLVASRSDRMPRRVVYASIQDNRSVRPQRVAAASPIFGGLFATPLPISAVRAR